MLNKFKDVSKPLRVLPLKRVRDLRDQMNSI